MTVFEKLQEVSSYAKEGKILLYCEGMFWKAYQEAAYLFTTCLKPYQVNKNYIKKIQTEVLSLGFPRPSTSKILSGYQYEEVDDRIVISVQNIEYSQEYNRLSPYFEKKFIYDSYSCRKGKGTLMGIRRLHHHMRSCSRNYTEDCYVLKMDLKSYFMNISRERLYSHIEESLPDNFEDKEFILWLTKEIIMAEPIVNCCVKGRLSDWKDLPVEKSLFYAKEGNGMPIGNLTSQLFSNIYLNGFDNWMKRTCRCQHYGRYVDDFYIVHNSQTYLLRLIPEIRRYLRQELGLCVHPDKFYLQHYMKGIKFLGAVVKPYCILPARRLKMNFRKTCHEIESCTITPFMMRTRLNSYLGLLCNQSSYRLIQKELNRLSVPYMYGCFKMRSGRFKYSLYQF